MNKQVDSRKAIAIILIIVAILIIVIMAVSANRGNKKTAEDNTTNENTVQNQVNYQENADGSKVNTSDKVSEDKKVGDVTIEKSNLVYENGMSKLTSKVTNNGSDLENLEFTVKFLDNNGKEIDTNGVEIKGAVGPIKKGEVKYLDLSLTQDVTNAADVVYTITK